MTDSTPSRPSPAASLTLRLAGLLFVLVLLAGTGCAHSDAVHDRTSEESTTVSSPSGNYSLSGDELRRSTGYVEKMLENRFAGVRVFQEGSRMHVRIRGAHSGLYRGESLFVVDGLRIRSAPGRALSGLRPHEIASIDVLRPSVAFTLYGDAASHGAVVIETR